jgi:hypothetical protein
MRFGCGRRSVRFVLSKTDEAGLAELLLGSSGDAALAGLEPAGYHDSRTRDEICLSEADVHSSIASSRGPGRSHWSCGPRTSRPRAPVPIDLGVF